MGEEYKKFLEAVKLQEEKDTYSILTEKYKKIAQKHLYIFEHFF